METKIKKTISALLIWLVIIPPDITRSASQEIMYPLQQVAKLECRYEKFADLDSKCKENLKILKTDDYQKYADLNEWYNEYTRRYTVLRWSSYTYWWDLWNWWHMWVDIATSEWTPVYAMADWEIIIAQNKLEFWNLISIKHEINWKKVVSNYAHLSKIDVKVWEEIKAWDKIWEVWSTWNSTWNHLHFQIDVTTKSSPAYYSYDTCPYSYNDIVNNWKCFQDLQNLTVDPLAFLETSGTILNNMVIKEVSIKKPKNTITSIKTNNNTSWNFNWIFDKPVYIDSEFDDIIEVQKIYRKLGYYKWSIDWNYNSLLQDIIRYQLDKWVILSTSDDWAWYFWPKTRAQTKKDFDKYLASNNNNSNEIVTKEVVSWKEIKKISREWMLTREEIEEREIKEFQRKYDIDIKSNEIWDNVWLWINKKINLKITDKRWNWFKWNTPYPISFIIDQNIIDVFPNKFYNFTDWKREITLTGKKVGDTTLYIKMWNKTIETIKLKVFDDGKAISPKSAIVLAKSKVILWDKNSWAVMLKDEKWARLLNLRYTWDFDLKAEWNAKICIKTWDVKNIKNIMKKECKENEYIKSKVISYKDTVWWLVIFDYKVFDDQAKIKLYSFNEKKDLIILNLKADAPKWLTESYAYYDDVIKILENNIATSELKQWYFLEKRAMTEKETIIWIKNTLLTIKKDTIDKNIIVIIDSNLEILSKENVSSFNPITRKDFLDKAYKYLVFNKSPQVSITYRDLEKEDNKKANTIFDKSNTWKDKFWENYYQPYQHITRWEWAYVISLAIDKTKNSTLTLWK